MRSCICKEWGPPSSLSIEDVAEEPQPGRAEVAIAVHACSVNFPDVLVIQGKYQVKPKLPFVPGGEVAGFISAVGEGCSRGFKVGDRVVAFVGIGGFTTHLVAKENAVAPLPSAIDFVTASAFLVAYGTADYALRVRARLRQSELVLVLGAAGGVGLAAVQLAKATGAVVIAAASTPEKLQACRDAGADFLLNYRAKAGSRARRNSGSGAGSGGNDGAASPDRGGKWRDALRELTGGRGIDVVLDNVGGDDSEVAIRSMAVGGRYLVVGFASGVIPSPPLNLVLLKEANVMGIFWGSWLGRQPSKSAEQMKHLVGLYSKGVINPVIKRVYSLEDVPRALEDMQARRVVGKVVVDTRSAGGGGGRDTSRFLPQGAIGPAASRL